MKSKIASCGPFVFALLVMGCSKSKPVPPAKDVHSEHGQAGEPQNSGATVHDMWTQITEEQAKLEAAIRSGDLANVHHLAFGIRDLAIALAAKATGPNATELEKLVDDIKVSAGKLDEYGDSGNLSDVKKEYAKFQEELNSLRILTRRP